MHFVCGVCHRPAPQQMLERTSKFTLFFIPLFPVAKSRYARCAHCGLSTPMSAARADEYVASTRSPQLLRLTAV
ncbi:zinc-ribbon domain-containing protein [Jatrophihabitans sp. GAS493]|uniref:zinc-ribbon domain-containing protein n=1 Tax=Jatrophihabitans sp. GAS493 TaxID=1907575 RepID=UPI001F5333B3|nr:zinc-ribbon domain-containing protein [Jatrophihabitans sp. GAS493]